MDSQEACTNDPRFLAERHMDQVLTSPATIFFCFSENGFHQAKCSRH